MDHVEKAIHTLAIAFCELKTPDYTLYKASLESLARMVRSQVLADMERDYQSAMAAVRD